MLRGKPRRETKPRLTRTTRGGWRRNDRKVQHVKQGYLYGNQWEFMCRKADSSVTRVRRARRAGVRASIVAMKPGNAGGAKGPRKMDAT